MNEISSNQVEDETKEKAAFQNTLSKKVATAGIFIAVGLVLSFLNPFAYFTLFGTKINPFAFTKSRMIPLDGFCRISQTKTVRNPRPIEKIGKLTRIAFSESEKRELVNDLKNIDKLMSKICEIDTDNVEPLYFLNEDCVTLRADKPDTNQAVDDIIKNAPEMKNGHYIVPRIIKK